jgi:hypothetical protein
VGPTCQARLSSSSPPFSSSPRWHGHPLPLGRELSDARGSARGAGGVGGAARARPLTRAERAWMLQPAIHAHHPDHRRHHVHHHGQLRRGVALSHVPLGPAPEPRPRRRRWPRGQRQGRPPRLPRQGGWPRLLARRRRGPALHGRGLPLRARLADRRELIADTRRPDLHGPPRRQGPCVARLRRGPRRAPPRGTPPAAPGCARDRAAAAAAS